MLLNLFESRLRVVFEMDDGDRFGHVSDIDTCSCAGDED